jgi:hypothetical protein
MSERVRSFIARLRGVLANRRRSRRYVAHLPVRVGFHGENGKDASRVEGFTHDVSASGIALILPAIRIRERYLSDSAHKLIIIIETSDKPITLIAAPVRYEPLQMQNETEKGFLLAVKILDTTTEDYAAYLAVLNSLK